MAVDRPSRPPGPAGGLLHVVGTELVGFTLLGVAIDYATNGWPWATAGLTMLGLAVAMTHLIRAARPRGTAP